MTRSEVVAKIDDCMDHARSCQQQADHTSDAAMRENFQFCALRWRRIAKWYLGELNDLIFDDRS